MFSFIAFMIKKVKPSTSSLRSTYLLKKNYLDNFFEKKNKTNYFSSNGKNNHGRITVAHRGGGHKQLYRNVIFNREISQISGYVKTIVYDPNRTANLAGILIKYNQYLYTMEYILAPEGLKKNQYIESSKTADITIGNALPLCSIPIGTLLHNISLKPKKGAKFIRSAGTFAQLTQKIGNRWAKIKLRSGQFRLIPLDCYASIGSVSNFDRKLQKIGKAGRSRWLNKRPHVRGVAKNPVDHPHGGGEGKTSGGRPSVTPKGKITKGKPTRKK